MIIERKEYLEKLIAWKDKQLIKIVTGVRRCGKSMLLEIYRNYLKEHGIEEEQIISINFEDLDYEELTDYRKLDEILFTGAEFSEEFLHQRDAVRERRITPRGERCGGGFRRPIDILSVSGRHPGDHAAACRILHFDPFIGRRRHPGSVDI